MDMDKTIACAVILVGGCAIPVYLAPNNSGAGYLFGLVAGFTVSYIVFCIKNRPARGNK